MNRVLFLLMILVVSGRIANLRRLGLSGTVKGSYSVFVLNIGLGMSPCIIVMVYAPIIVQRILNYG